MGRTAIVGAGMTGLVCADALRGDVTVFEKSRAVGGRIASREVEVTDAAGRTHGITFDHGTPAIRPSDALFAGLLSDLADAGAAAEWENGLVVGRPHMRAMLAPLAEGLDIRFHHRVERLRRVGNEWWLDFAPHEREGGTAEGEEGPFDRVVVALPAHQAAKLVGRAAPHIAGALETVSMKPCWTLMAAFDGEQGAPSGTATGVEWLVREHEKPGRAAHPRAYTMHMNLEWSIEHLEMERDRTLPLMLDVLRDRTGERGEPLIVMAHRWRYANTAYAMNEPFLESGGLFVGGDWASGACAENAWASGKAIAQRLLAG